MQSLTSRRLLQLTWTIEGIALSAPIMSLMPDSHPAWLQNHLFFFIIAPFALFFFLLYVAAKFSFIPLAIVVCAVILRSDIPGRTKIAVTVLGFVAFFSLIHWAEVFQHTW